jgi:WD repeat and SOF domain-containing protein 1
VLEFSGRHAFRGVDHHWERAQFATAGAAVEVWDHERSEPVQSFAWGADTITTGERRRQARHRWPPGPARGGSPG